MSFKSFGDSIHSLRQSRTEFMQREGHVKFTHTPGALPYSLNRK
jgi:hypothetical protein